MKSLKFLGTFFALLLIASSLSACAAPKSKSASVVPQVKAVPEITATEIAANTITDGIVYFAFNEYDIIPEYRAILNEKGKALREHESIRVRIEGHCDERGTQEYNLALGERRARAAYEYLVLLGVNPTQLEIISYGKENPGVPGTGEAVWALNRRANFRLISQ